MLLQILDLLEVLLGQTVTCGVGNVDNGSTCSDDSLNDTSQILVLGTACILAVELDVLDVLLGIFRGSNGTLDDFLAGGVELVLDVRVGGTDTCVDTLVLGILQRIVGNVDILLHGTRQRTDGRPCNGLGNLNYRIEITRRTDGESCLNHVDTQLLQRLGHLNLLNGVQLASRHLLAIAKRRVENKQSVTHNLSILIFLP